MTARRVSWRVCLWLALVVSGLAGPAWADKRVALVVGVSAYAAAPKLVNTLADATEIAAALRRLHFDVELVTDPDRAALEAAVRRLGERAPGAEAALFYFAGHGLEVGGRNWLLPASARLRSDRDLPFEALDLGLIFDQLDGVARVSLFVLDSCRDNPFRLQLARASRAAPAAGLRAQQAASGSLVSYSTAPGTEAEDGRGQHSPFTAALLKHIERPGLTVQQVLNAVRAEVKAATAGRQVPWESSALDGDFYFVQPPEQRVAAAAPAAAPPAAVVSQSRGQAAEVEDNFFRAISGTRTPEELNAFLARFPDGTYAPLVRIWLRQAASGAPAEASAPASAPASGPASPPRPAAPVDAGFVERLAAALRTLQPTLSDAERAAIARGFAGRPAAGRALAVQPASGIWSSVWDRGTDDQAGDAVLDTCEFKAGRPCALVARGAEVLAPGSDGEWVRASTGRVTYAGSFNPARIPTIAGRVRGREEVKGYRALPAPKAMALRFGQVYVTRAADQRTAEERVLGECMADPARGGDACYLYAVGDGVVLTRWLTAPFTPSKPATATADVALERIAAAAGRVRPESAITVRTSYAEAKNHRALAMNLGTGLTFRWDKAPTPEEAERYALEACQLQYNQPCVLLAVDSQARTDDPREAPFRPMERIAYAGPFRLDRLPMAMARFEAVRNYASLGGAKAIAVRPSGALVRVSGGKSSRAEAERDALEGCRPPDDPAPCFLYASGDEVVLPQRRTEPSP